MQPTNHKFVAAGLHIDILCKDSKVINPFSVNVLLLHPLKLLENLRFSDVFRGYRIGSLVRNGLNLKLLLRYIFSIKFLNIILSLAFDNLWTFNLRQTQLNRWSSIGSFKISPYFTKVFGT